MKLKEQMKLVGRALLLFLAQGFVVQLCLFFALKIDFSEISELKEVLIFITKSWMLVIFLGPINEEILYRGPLWLLSKFRWFAASFWWRWSIIFLSAIAFGFIHFDIAGYLHVFTAAFKGVILGWLTVKTRSIFPSIVTHVIWNGAMWILVWFIVKIVIF